MQDNDWQQFDSQRKPKFDLMNKLISQNFLALASLAHLYLHQPLLLKFLDPPLITHHWSLLLSLITNHCYYHSLQVPATITHHWTLLLSFITGHYYYHSSLLLSLITSHYYYHSSLVTTIITHHWLLLLSLITDHCYYPSSLVTATVTNH